MVVMFLDDLLIMHQNGARLLILDSVALLGHDSGDFSLTIHKASLSTQQMDFSY